MTTLDRPSFAVVIDSLEDPPRRLRCSVFACEPRYRIVRAVTAVKRMTTFAHPGLRRLLSEHWQAVRTHSSWSRA